MKRIAQIEQAYVRDDYPAFRSGDTLRIHVKIKEGDKERIQVFQGTVISRRGSGTGATFTVRKISSGVGVERIFPLFSPNIAKIEKVRSGIVRRNKLYYLRELTGKSARIRERLTEKGAAEEAKVVDEAAAEIKPEPVAEPEPEPEPKAEAEAAEPEAEAAAEEEAKVEETAEVAADEADEEKKDA